jgi:hypothetical protein
VNRGGGLKGSKQVAEGGADLTDAPPIIIDEDAAIDSAFSAAPWPNLLCACPPQRLGFGRAPGRCSARAAGDAAGVGPD